MVQRSSQRAARKATAGQERRLQILREAAEVFRARGFHRASMEEIADRLGMHKGNLYYYFPSKQDLLYFCQEQALDRLITQAKESARSAATHRDRLARMIEAHLICVLDELGGSLAHAEFEELPPLQRRRILRLRDRYESCFRGTLRAGAAAGEFRPGDVKLRAMAILGALNWTVKWHRAGGGQSGATVAGAFADLLLDGLANDGKQND